MRLFNRQDMTEEELIDDADCFVEPENLTCGGERVGNQHIAVNSHLEVLGRKAKRVDDCGGIADEILTITTTLMRKQDAILTVESASKIAIFGGYKTGTTPREMRSLDAVNVARAGLYSVELGCAHD
jgi:hypothetical protein